MSDNNLLEENNRLKAENDALKDNLRTARKHLIELGADFFPLRQKLEDVILEAKKIQNHNKTLINAGDSLYTKLLWTDEYDKERCEDARKIWEAAKKGNQK
jgi:hypothetical protein